MLITIIYRSFTSNAPVTEYYSTVIINVLSVLIHKFNPSSNLMHLYIDDPLSVQIHLYNFQLLRSTPL